MPIVHRVLDKDDICILWNVEVVTDRHVRAEGASNCPVLPCGFGLSSKGVFEPVGDVLRPVRGVDSALSTSDATTHVTRLERLSLFELFNSHSES